MTGHSQSLIGKLLAFTGNCYSVRVVKYKTLLLMQQVVFFLFVVRIKAVTISIELIIWKQIIELLSKMDSLYASSIIFIVNC